jgi:hypothetical protein
MVSISYQPFSSFCPLMKGLLLEIIRQEYQPLLQVPACLPEQAWEQVVTRVNPLFFYLNDGTPLIQIGEASRHSLLKALSKNSDLGRRQQ